MTYIFMDESGDLGFDFKTNTTNKFLITFLVSDNFHIFGRVVKKTFRKLPKDIIKKHSGVLHFREEKYKTHKIFFKNWQKIIAPHKNIGYIATIVLDKKELRLDNYNIDKSDLFNKMTLLLLRKLYFNNLLNLNEVNKFYVSRRETNKFLNKKFTNYIQDNILNEFKSRIEVMIKMPFEVKALQTVDALSFSIFRHQEYSNSEYFDILKPFVKMIEIYDFENR